jgi:hypothetical protein
VDIHTHGIVHLENHMETQDTELEERAERIADLEKQLLELQGHLLSLPTLRRSMPYRALMRVRSHRYRMWGDKILSGLG